MTQRQRVVKAIKFQRPDRVPVWFWNRDQLRGDVLGFELSPYKGDAVKKSEWGYVWENLGDGTLGQPKRPVIPAWDTLKNFNYPDPEASWRFRDVDKFKKEAGDRYINAELGISGFNTYAFLRGFANALIDFKLDKKNAAYLLDKVFEFENALIGLSSQHGFHGMHFADDWGTQKDLIIDPALWRELFKPRYRQQFEHAHDLGMHVWFHSCGNTTSVIPDFHEIGVDVINISQPNAVDIQRIGKLLRGKQCFMVPISYQTVSISGSPAEIKDEAKRLYEHLGTADGGFIGYVEEYSVMGMTEENYKACAEAFIDVDKMAGSTQS
jgi:hypothetical protein